MNYGNRTSGIDQYGRDRHRIEAEPRGVRHTRALHDVVAHGGRPPRRVHQGLHRHLPFQDAGLVGHEEVIVSEPVVEEEVLMGPGAKEEMNGVKELYKDGALPASAAEAAMKRISKDYNYPEEALTEVELAPVAGPDELAKEGSACCKSVDPLFISEAELAKMTNSKDTVPDSTKENFVNGVYEESLSVTKSPEKARFEAEQAELLINKYNDELAQGSSAGVAYNKAMDSVTRNYQNASKAAAIAGGGMQVEKAMSDKFASEQEVAGHMANSPPEARHNIMKEKVEIYNDRRAKRAEELTNTFVHEHVDVPRAKVSRDIRESEVFKNAATMEAVNNPIVREELLTDIYNKNKDNMVSSKRDLDSAVNEEIAGRRKSNGLELLKKDNTEKAINGINNMNEKLQEEMALQKADEEEKEKVKAAEERLANDKEEGLIEARGRAAFDKVYGRTGDEAAANVAREEEMARARGDLNKAREMRKSQVLDMLGPLVVNSETVQEVADHIAKAHAGLNPVGSTLEDLGKKHGEEMRRNMEVSALLNEGDLPTLQVSEIIPPTTDKIGILEGSIRLPLKGFSGEDARTEEEGVMNNNVDARRAQVRNKVIKDAVETGLNVIQTKDGFTHISEAAKELDVTEGKVFYPEIAKGLMDKQNIDTSQLEHKVNTGERKDIGVGEGYWEAKISGYKLDLPSPSNPVPALTMTDGENSLNIEYASGMDIQSGDLVVEPWNEFVKKVKPTVNGPRSQEIDFQVASEMEAIAENEKKAKNLENIATEVYTNKDGSKFVETTPQYGVTELLPMKQAIESFRLGPSGIAAVSEKKKMEAIPLDMARVESARGNEMTFVETVLRRVGGTGSGARSISKVSSLNGKIDPERARIVGGLQEDAIQKHISNAKTPEAEIKNSILRKSEAYARSMKIPTEEFLKIISHVPEATIKEMVNYSRMGDGRKDITETHFYNQISRVLPHGVNVSTVTEILFNNISNKTKQPNTVGGEIIEKTQVPAKNLKAVQQIKISDSPKGRSETFQSVPNKGDTQTQVIEEIKTGGNTSSSFKPVSSSSGSPSSSSSTGSPSSSTGSSFKPAGSTSKSIGSSPKLFGSSKPFGLTPNSFDSMLVPGAGRPMKVIPVQVGTPKMIAVPRIAKIPVRMTRPTPKRRRYVISSSRK